MITGEDTPNDETISKPEIRLPQAMSAVEMAKPLGLRHITSAQTLILMCLGNARFKGQHTVWLAQGTIAFQTKLSKATVIRAMRDLEERGYISRKRRTRSNGSRTSDHVYLDYASDGFAEIDPLSCTMTPRPKLHGDSAQGCTMQVPESLLT